MVLKPRFWGFWTAIVFAAWCIAAVTYRYTRGDPLGDPNHVTGQVTFAGVATLLGAFAYRSAKRRKLSNLPSHGWDRTLELVCLVAPVLFIAVQDDPVALIQLRPLPLIVLSWVILAYAAAATGTAEPRTRSILRPALVTTAVALSAYSVAGWYQDRQLTRTMTRSWPLLADGIASIPSRFPLQRKTAAASEAEKIALSLGISMVPNDSSPPNEDRKRYDEVRGLVSNYIAGAFVQSTRYVGPPPADLAQYLDSNRNTLNDLRDLLLSDAPLGWEVDVTNTRYFSILPVRLVGHLNINKLLIASALYSLVRGDGEGASTFLRAAMIWSASLRQRPDLISRLIYVAESRDLVASILKFPLPHPDWFIERHREDMRVLLSESMAYQNWLVVRLIRQPPRFRLQNDSGQNTMRFDGYGLWRWAMRPVLLQSQRHTIDMERTVLEELLSDSDCASDSTAFTETWGRHYGMWLSYGIYFGETTPNVYTAWSRVQMYRLLSELAAVLERSDTHSATQHNLRSTVCSAMSWGVDGRGDGLTNIRLVSPAFMRNGAGPSRPAIVESQMVPSLEHASPASPGAATGSVQIVQNGGFEEADAASGEGVGWLMDDSGSASKYGSGRSLARQAGWVLGARSNAYEPHDGRWFFLLNSMEEQEARVSQTISIPKDATTALLTFWLRVDHFRPDSVTGLQDAALEIRLTTTGEATTDAILDVISRRNAIVGSYQSRSYRFNVAPWRNRSLSLQFAVPATQSGTPATAFLLDDVTVEVQP